MSKQPFCIVEQYIPAKGICCTIRGTKYQYLVSGPKFSAMVNGEWMQLSPSEQASKALECQTLQDRYAAAEKRHAEQVARSHHVAESRRIRRDRARRELYRSAW